MTNIFITILLSGLAGVLTGLLLGQPIKNKLIKEAENLRPLKLLCMALAIYIISITIGSMIYTALYQSTGRAQRVPGWINNFCGSIPFGLIIQILIYKHRLNQQAQGELGAHGTTSNHPDA